MSRVLKNAVIFGLAACFYAMMPASVFAQPETAIRSTLVIKVDDRDLAARNLVDRATRDGGYFVSQTDEGVRLRIPTGKAEAFIAFAESRGILVGREYEAIFLGEELARMKASLKAREKIHGQYLEVLGSAGTDGVFLVEKEIINLIGQIESLKGEINYLQYRLQFAEIAVEFQFRDRTAPVADGRSSFPWLNSMNLVDLLRDF